MTALERKSFVTTWFEVADAHDNDRALFERFYNPTRRHSTLGHVSPVEFEKAQKA